ncbi:hypothetical protein GW590_11185 [Rahnella sp. SAP-1]|uniref:Tetrapyrrole methylase domain-containing protein n=1 Tax=Rouxiella aceris TaxID=2703884 RepID=A0A848MJW8_9GAMM|nr:SAM-dependent methyltransferase [Rouxiella aceris]NMP27429.1 hypothetical protein [Rouxiella aceris]
MNKLSVIGSGMLGVNQITRHGFSVIHTASKVFWIGEIAGLEHYLSDASIAHHNLSYLYEEGKRDTDNYIRIIAYLIREVNDCEHLCLVVPGHPQIGVTIVQQLQQLSQSGGFELFCFPGISSFDAMINDIWLDPLEEGASLLDANRLIIYDYMMEPCINYFIYHVCSIGNIKTDYLIPQKSNKVSYLKSKLLKHYQRTQQIFLFSAATCDEEAPDKIEGTLSQLEDLLAHVTYRHSLYIPASLPNKMRVNYEFLKEINIT